MNSRFLVIRVAVVMLGLGFAVESVAAGSVAISTLSGELFGPISYNLGLGADVVSATISNSGGGAVTGVVGPDMPASIALIPVTFQIDLSLAPQPIRVDSGTGQAAETFSGSGNFSMTSDSRGNLLSGQITGGWIQGQLGSTGSVSITLNMSNLTSDIVALSGSSSTLVLSASLENALTSSCENPGPGGICASTANQYFSNFPISQGPAGVNPVRWSIGGEAFSSSIPESSLLTWSMAGLALVSLIKTRCTVRNSGA